MSAADQGPCVCTALRKASRAVSRFYDEALAPTGLTTPQFAVLRQVAGMGDPPLSRLAEALVMDRTTLYRTLQPLVRDALLSITPGPGRAKSVHLTDEGRRRMQAATPPWEAAQAAFLHRFGAAAWAGMVQDLKRAAEAAG